MASLPTLPSRLRAPLLFLDCAYCSAEIECVDDGAFELSSGGEPVRRKVECVVCGKRFLVSKGADGQVHASTPLTIHLPSEILTIIFVHLAATRKRPTASLFNSALVSKLWNSCATPILYRDLNIDEWDWRMKGTLLRTLDESLSLLPHIRSLNTSYPRLKDWRRSMLSTATTKEYERRFPSFVGNLLPAQAEAAQALEDDGERNPEIWSQAEDWARFETVEAAEEAGAAPWLDRRKGPDGPGDSGRRAGACELLALVNRSPSLQTLHLERFDFGEVAGDDLDSRLPLSLHRIHTLVLNTLHPTLEQPELNPLPIILPRLPNLEFLDLGDSITNPDEDYRFPRLRVLRLRNFLSLDGICNLRRIVKAASGTLRSLHLTVKVNFLRRLCPILSIPGALEDLTLVTISPKTTPLLLLELFAFLSSHSTLQNFTTLITLNPALVESLPPGLVSLAASPSRNDQLSEAEATAELVEGLVALIESKKTRTPALMHARIGPLHGSMHQQQSVVDLVEAARTIGLEIRLQRFPIGQEL